ncbi:MAG TPA: hypothetical protein VFW39_09805 [Sphingomicrobium sp.]|nr:hypothetical protein [Sphingomicrobium sp.]
MGPFEFIILFFSFIYTLALTHLLFAWTRMIRHRRELVFSWPHFLWMLVAMANLAVNWISQWDFRTEHSLSLGTIASGFLFVVINYFVCALVSPDFEGGETYDMKHFHACEGPTYIAATLVLILISIVENFLAGVELKSQNWANENNLVITFLVPAALPLLIKAKWMQILAPAVLLAETVAYAVIYYPVLA